MRSGRFVGPLRRAPAPTPPRCRGSPVSGDRRRVSRRGPPPCGRGGRGRRGARPGAVEAAASASIIWPLALRRGRRLSGPRRAASGPFPLPARPGRLFPPQTTTRRPARRWRPQTAVRARYGPGAVHPDGALQRPADAPASGSAVRARARPLPRTRRHRSPGGRADGCPGSGPIPGSQVNGCQRTRARISIAARAARSDSYISHMWRPSGVAVCSTSHTLVSVPSMRRKACS